MKIRPFQPDDLPALKEITVEAFDGVSIDQGIQHIFGDINGQTWQWRKARHLDDDAARTTGEMFVLEEAGKPVGTFTVWLDREAGIGHIPNLVLSPECRGKGLGRKLIHFALDYFRENGLSHAKIETLVQNEVGSHLYQAVGFQIVSQQVHFLGELSEMEQTPEGESFDS